MDCCRENACMSCICEYFTTIVRVFGIMIAVGFWVMGISVMSFHAFGIYLIFAAVVLSILEGLFLFETCITGCCRDGGFCWKVWKVVSFLDNWKRTILYLLLAIPCFIVKVEDGTKDKTAVVIIAGVLLCVLGLIYFIRSFFFCRRKDEEGQPEEQSSTKGKKSKKYKQMEDETRAEAGTAQTVSAEKQQSIESRYPDGDVIQVPRDDDMGTKGDVGIPSLEERYPQ